jgi:hypothetical protein
MKKIIGFLLALCAFACQAATCDLIIGQLDSFGNLVPRLLTTPAGCSTTSGMIVYDATGAQQPRIFTLDATLKFTSGVLGVDASALPAATPFNFTFPSNRTLSMSTDYQAGANTKAAVITVSPQCTNTTTVIAASACTLQVRMDASALTCGTGTVYATWTSTYALGLLLTNASGSPISIHLPIGGHFILCPTAGTFTITTAVDQAAG